MCVVYILHLNRSGKLLAITTYNMFTLFHKARVHRTLQLSKCTDMKKKTLQPIPFSLNHSVFDINFCFDIKLSHYSWMIFSLILIHRRMNDIFFYICCVWFLLTAVQNVYLLLYYHIPRKYIFNHRMINKHWLQIPSNK